MVSIGGKGLKMAKWQPFSTFIMLAPPRKFAENKLVTSIIHIHQMAYAHCTSSTHALWRCVIYWLSLVSTCDKNSRQTSWMITRRINSITCSINSTTDEYDHSILPLSQDDRQLQHRTHPPQTSQQPSATCSTPQRHHAMTPRREIIASS